MKSTNTLYKIVIEGTYVLILVLFYVGRLPQFSISKAKDNIYCVNPVSWDVLDLGVI